MKTKILDLMKDFEYRNNVSLSINICSDGSGCVNEFWNEDTLESFETISELTYILKNVKYKKDISGHCIRPVERI